MIALRTKILNAEREVLRTLKKQIIGFQYRFGVCTALPPVTCQLEITTICNYNCPMCNRNFVDKARKDKMMSMDEFKTILGNLPKSLKHISFEGQLGDAFCHPHFYDFLDVASKQNYLVSIRTNGNRLTKKRIDELTKFNLWRLQVSLDSTDKEIYSSIRGGDIEKIVDNLAYLKRRSPGAQLFVAMVLMKDTAGQIQGFFETANNIKADLITLQMLIPYSMEIWREQSLYNFPDKLRDVAGFINDQSSKSVARLIRGGGTTNWDFAPVNGPCDAVFHTPQILVNGDVVPCCMVSNASEEFAAGISAQINPRNYVIGNVLEEPLSALWNNKKIKRIRKEIIDSYKYHNRHTGKSKPLCIKDFETIKNSTSVQKACDYCKVCALRWQVGG